MRTPLTSSLLALLLLAGTSAGRPAASAAVPEPGLAAAPQRSARVQSSRAGRSTSSVGRSSSSSFQGARSSGVSRVQSSGSRTISRPSSSSQGRSYAPPSSPSPSVRPSFGQSGADRSSPTIRTIPTGSSYRSGSPSFEPRTIPSPSGSRYPAGWDGRTSPGTSVGTPVGASPEPGVITRYGGSLPGADRDLGAGWSSAPGVGGSFPSEATEGSPVLDLRSSRSSGGRVRFPAPYRPAGSVGLPDEVQTPGSGPSTRWTRAPLSPVSGGTSGTAPGTDAGRDPGRLVERYREATRRPTTGEQAPTRPSTAPVGTSDRVRVRPAPSRAYGTPPSDSLGKGPVRSVEPARPGDLSYERRADVGQPSGGAAERRPSTPSELERGPDGARRSQGDVTPIRLPDRRGGTPSTGGRGGDDGASRGGLTRSYGRDLKGLDDLRRKDPVRAGHIARAGDVVARTVGAMGAVAVGAVGGIVRPGYGGTIGAPPYGGAVRPGHVLRGHSGYRSGWGYGYGYSYPWGLGSACYYGGFAFRACYGWWWPSPYWWAPYACSYWSPWYRSYPVYFASVIYREVEYDDDDDTTVIVYGGDTYAQPVGEAVAPAGSGVVAGGGIPPLSQRNSLATATQRYLELGDQAFRDGRYADAVQFYAKAVEFTPDQGDLYLVLADSLFAAGDYHYAAYAIRRALELDPSLVAASVDKHDFYADPSEFDRQLAVLEQFLADHPADQDARLVLAANFLFGGRPAAAVDLLQAAPGDLGDPAAGLVLDAAAVAQYGR